MYNNLKYITETAILATRDDGSQILIEPQIGELWALAASGALGEVAPYIQPPSPTYEEKIIAWRQVAHCEMIELQDAIIDGGFFEQAEAISAEAAPKWKIRWEARAGVFVLRSTSELSQYAQSLMSAASIDGDIDSWLDDLVKWTPPKPLEV